MSRAFSRAAMAALLLVQPVSAATDVVVTVPGKSDPWLAGMADGSTASGGDVAPAHSPVLVPLGLVAGQVLNFSATGSVAYDPSTALTPPDGSFLVGHGAGAQNGISNVVAPANALMGVFLTDASPHLAAAPATLDFGPAGTVPGGLNYLVLAPAVQQVFFIGDGKTATSVTQDIVVPSGATRLCLGTMDGSGWYNNIGSFTVTIESAWADLGLALAGTHGTPRCIGAGSLEGGSPLSLSLLDARENANACLVVGLSLLAGPFKGGTMVPQPDVFVPLVTGPAGTIALQAAWPAGLPTGLVTYYQWWIADPLGPLGFAASNGISGTTP